MERHHFIAGRIQQILAVLFFVGCLATIVLIYVLGSSNIAGISHFRPPSLMEYLTQPVIGGLAALAGVSVAQFLWARTWLKGNQRAKTPLVVFAILQALSFPYLTPFGIYCLWALLRKLPAKNG